MMRSEILDTNEGILTCPMYSSLSLLLVLNRENPMTVPQRKIASLDGCMPAAQSSFRFQSFVVDLWVGCSLFVAVGTGSTSKD